MNSRVDLQVPANPTRSLNMLDLVILFDANTPRGNILA